MTNYEEIAHTLDKLLDRYDFRYPLVTLDEFFDHAPEGDFSWKQDEAGDWVASQDEDAKGGWTQYAYAIDMGRTDGFRWVKAKSCDVDGNWDTDLYWSEEEAIEEGLDINESWNRFFNVDFYQYYGTNDYFLQWAKYYLDCADKGEGFDPLNDLLGIHTYDELVSTALDSVAYLDRTAFIKAAESVKKGILPTWMITASAVDEILSIVESKFPDQNNSRRLNRD